MGSSKRRKKRRARYFNYTNTTERARQEGYRSEFEAKLDRQLKKAGIHDTYECTQIEYTIPEQKKKYTPDFVLPNGIHIEAKGRWPLSDRKKFLWIRDSNPDIDIRIIFQDPYQKIRKGSKTTYADWCDKKKIKWASTMIPPSWLKEK